MEEVEEVEEAEEVEEEGQEIEGVEARDETAEDLDGAKDDEIDEINQPELQGEEAPDKNWKSARADDLAWCQMMLDVGHLSGIENKELANSDNGY